MSHVLLLLLASLALLVGPGLYVFGRRSRALHELVDGFALVVIAGICLLVVLPHVVAQIGLVGLLLASAGVLLPALAHRLGSGPRWTLVLIALALVVHVLLDGAVLSMQSESELLGWAVVAHRLPVGFAIALAAQGSRRPVWSMWGVAFGMILANVGGFVAGPSLIASLPEVGAVGLEALVAGVLLHVALAPHRGAEAEHAGCGDASASNHDHDTSCSVDHHDHGHHCDHDHSHDAHHVHDHDRDPGHGHHHVHDDHLPHHPEPHGGDRMWSAVGALIGVVAMLGGALLGSGAVESSVPTFIQTFGVLVPESAPALLIGYALAGVVPFLLTPARTRALGRGGRSTQALRGVDSGPSPVPARSFGDSPSP